MKTCSECHSNIPEAATVCSYCISAVEGKECPDCLTSCKKEAAVCRWCNFRFMEKEPSKGKIRTDFKPFMIKAEPLPSFLFLFKLKQQEIRFYRDRIEIITPGFLGLSMTSEEIPWDKVGGYNYRNGLIWDGLSIETRGQSAGNFYYFAKDYEEDIRNVLSSY